MCIPTAAMLENILQFGGTSAVIVVAGTFLTRYTDAIAGATGLGRSLAGMLLLALATSLPEMAIACNATLIGAVDVAVGDLMGSNLLNLLLLAVMDLSHYSRGRMLSSAASAHALGGGASIFLTAIALLCLLNRSSWALFGWIGVESLALFAGYAVVLRMLYIQRRVAARKARTEAVSESGERAVSLRRAVVGYLLAALAILAAAPFLTQAAERLAEQTGLGGTFVGTTLVALATSLPEAVTTFTAVRRDAMDLAIGNIFGSNVFNVVILAVADLCTAGSLVAGVSATHAVTATWSILITTVVVMGQLYGAERRYGVLEPDATLVIALVIAALAMVYLLR